MDWDSKTAQRAALKDAAADTFNTIMTPGQTLLQSLQAAEVVRKDKYFSTVGAKMKAAREKLPSLAVKHAVPSHASIFITPPPAEVHRLLPDVQPEKADMAGVQLMLEAQLEAHRGVWAQFLAVRDRAQAQLDAAVAGAAGELRRMLAADSQEIEGLMAVLDPDRIMVLTEPEVHQVWDAVAQRTPERSRWIEELGAGLEAAEEQRRHVVEGQLVEMVRGMSEVAALSEGEVERVLEREALHLNTAILNNRRAYADLLGRLHVAEVEAERQRRQRWEEALNAWRSLRFNHALQLFTQRIKSPEFAEPAERLALFEAIREWQAGKAAAAMQHMEGLAQALPPHLSLRRIQGWREAVEQLHSSWLQEAAAWQDKLLAHDSQVLEGRGWAAYEALTREVLEYKGVGGGVAEGYPEDEARARLDSECGAALRGRRAAALDLMQQTQRFLEWQAQRWHQFLVVLGDWMLRLAQLYEEHKATTNSNEATVRSALKTQRDLFNVEDAAREAALEAAVAAVRQGASERDLDSQVSAALSRLDDIEAYYRTFHTTMTSIARSFPRTVAEADDRVPKLEPSPLPQHPPPPPPPPPPTPSPPPTPPPPIKTLQMPDGSSFDVMQDLMEVLSQQAAHQAVMEEHPELAAPPPAPEPPPAPPVLEEPPPPPPAAVKGKPGKPDAKAKPGAKGGKAAAAAPSAAAPPLLPPAHPEPPPPLPDPAVEVSPLSSSGRPHCADLVLPQGAIRQVLEGVQVGLLREAVEFSARASSTAQSWAEEREAALTEELDAHLRAHRQGGAGGGRGGRGGQGGAGGGKEEGEGGEPRAGRIEEETRMARSVELVAQRRRVEGHLRLQGKAVKAQAAQAEEWQSQVEGEVGAKVCRLLSYDAHLGQALSAKGIDIRKREAEALRQRIEREMAAQLAEVQQQVAQSCQKIIEANTAFDAAELKTFEEGGHYSADNVSVYRSSLAAMNQVVEAGRQAQLDSLRQLQDKLTQQADAALAHVMELLPSHHEDMKLIEAMDEMLAAARRKARTELARNAEASSAISAELDKLDALLTSVHQAAQQHNRHNHHHAPPRTPSQSDAGRVSYSASPGPGTGQSGAAAAPGSATGLASKASVHGISGGLGGAGEGGEDVVVGALAQCTTIVESMDKLRSMLYSQARALDFLKSTGLVIQPIDLTLDAAEDVPAASLDRRSGTWGTAAGPAPTAFRPGAGVAFADLDDREASQQAPPALQPAANKPAAAPSAGPKAGAAGAGKPGAAPVAGAGAAGKAGAGGGADITLAKDIEAVIDACKHDTSVLAQAYYAKLYPTDKDGAKRQQTATKPAPRAVTPPKTRKTSAKPGAAGAVPPTPPASTPSGPQPLRPIRYPARIPANVELLVGQTDAVLEGLRQALRDHVAAGVKELRAQVIRAYRLVEHAPAVAMAALTQHELQAARAAQAAVRAQYRSQHARLVAQVEEQRRALHPTLAQPSGRSKLERLKAAEGQRAREFQQMLQRFVSEGVRGAELQGPVIRQRLVHLVSVMVRLLDNFMMPDDLPPIREDGSDNWVYALPGRKDDKQLFRLALANAEAQGETPVPDDPKAKPGVSPPARKPPAAGPKAGDAGSLAPGRPFGPLSWTLPGGNFDLASLGWTPEVAGGLPEVLPQAPAPGSEEVAPAPAKSGVAAGGRSSTPPPPPPAAKKAGPGPGAAAPAPGSAPGTVTITGMDTPCHRAGIRAYRANLQQTEAALRQGLQGLVREMTTWRMDETLWQRTWAELLAQLEGL
ncbi:hypothetical protein V8C86DRAFT_3130507 [Haematococcus lacustris]